MNFNLYLDDRSAKRLDAVARKTRTPRNALVRRAVGVWLDQQESVWPKEVLQFKPEPKLAPFEAHRFELTEPSDDPLGVGAKVQRRSRTKAKRQPAR